MDSKTHFWKLTFLDKVILHMPVKFEQAQMKKEWVICKKRPILQKTFEDNFLPQNPFLKFYHFLWDQSAHSCKIWTGLVKKLMRSFIVLGTKLAKFRFNLFLGELWSFFWFSNFWAFPSNFQGFYGFVSGETSFSAQFQTFQTLDGWNRMKNEQVMVVFLFFRFLSTLDLTFRVCLKRNLILCSILNILGFGWVK